MILYMIKIHLLPHFDRHIAHKALNINRIFIESHQLLRSESIYSFPLSL